MTPRKRHCCRESRQAHESRMVRYPTWHPRSAVPSFLPWDMFSRVTERNLPNQSLRVWFSTPDFSPCLPYRAKWAWYPTQGRGTRRHPLCFRAGAGKLPVPVPVLRRCKGIIVAWACTLSCAATWITDIGRVRPRWHCMQPNGSVSAPPKRATVKMLQTVRFKHYRTSLENVCAISFVLFRGNSIPMGGVEL